jgi:hypothetical protein
MLAGAGGQHRGRIDPKRLVFIDETPAFAGAGSFCRRLRHDRITAPCVIDGPINGGSFRAYVEQFLVPT